MIAAYVEGSGTGAVRASRPFEPKVLKKAVSSAIVGPVPLKVGWLNPDPPTKMMLNVSLGDIPQELVFIVPTV